jgi:hypothetical protein
MYRERTFDTTYDRRQLTSLTDQHRKGCDLLETVVPTKYVWDFDFKNAPVEPVTDVGSVLSFLTTPHRTIRDFERARQNYEDWQRSTRRVLKTAQDYADMVEWNALRSTRKALRANTCSVLSNLPRAVVIEILRLPWRERPSPKEIATVFARTTGRRVVEQTIKDLHRKRDQIDRAWVPMLVEADIEFARIFISDDADTELVRLFGDERNRLAMLRGAITPDSHAERQFAEIFSPQPDDDEDDDADEGRMRLRASIRADPVGGA